MYKPTIWKDHVEGIQEGTDMNAANFNNIEVGTMEANALAALNASYRRHATDVAKNNEAFVLDSTLYGADKNITVNLPQSMLRNNQNYNVVPVLNGATDGSVEAVLVFGNKTANSFIVQYSGSASSIRVCFIITGGMI